jgi:Co/Zn/Cd efflux system component
MTKLLLRLFVKNSENVGNPKTRLAVGKLSGVVGIISNLLLFAGKLAAGLLSGSVSITADAMNNLSDASSSIVTFVGFKLAEKPADEDHPYGHARFEYLSGLAVAALIIVIGFELAKTSVQKILNPAAVAFSGLTVAVLVGSIVVKLWLAIFNGAALADGAGFCGENVGFDTLLLHESTHLIGNFFVLRPGGQSLLNVRNILHLGNGGDHQAIVKAAALAGTMLHRAYAGRAGPGLAVHGAFMLADPADPLVKLQLPGIDPGIAIQGQLGKLLFKKFFIHGAVPPEFGCILPAHRPRSG